MLDSQVKRLFLYKWVQVLHYVVVTYAFKELDFSERGLKRRVIFNLDGFEDTKWIVAW